MSPSASGDVSTQTRTAVASDVRQRLADALPAGPRAIGPDDVLREVPGADSVHLLRVIADVERRWGVELDDEDIFGPITLDDLVTLVCAQLKAR
jgi:acyl carrier protein